MFSYLRFLCRLVTWAIRPSLIDKQFQQTAREAYQNGYERGHKLGFNSGRAQMQRTIVTSSNKFTR